MKLTRVILFPFLFRRYRSAVASAERLQSIGEWRASIGHLERLRESNIDSKRSAAMLATAYLFCGRNEDAVSEFQRITGHIRDPTVEAIKAINHAVALERLGRRSEAASVLRACVWDSWPVERREAAQRLLNELDGTCQAH
jgi:lipopolysaccharide biosynthesis regulator YciM